MKHMLLATGFSAMMWPLAETAHAAGTIENACLSSERRAASQTLCSCIQSVADKMLTNGEQRKGAAFFKDPHKSQEMRQSAKADDSVFWLKWKDFGDAAAKQCQ